jgi:hypothetical protein
MMISKGKLTYATLVTYLLMPVISFFMLFLSLATGGLFGLFLLVFFPIVAIQTVRKLRALSEPIVVRPEGLALYDAPSLVFFSVGSPKSVPVSRGEIFQIRVADTLERKAFRRKTVKGRSDMVVSTKAGKDFFVMKRPTDELRHAAWLLGFPQISEPQLLNGRFVPGTYVNTVDRVTEQRVYPIFALFVFISFSYLSWTVGVLRFIWIGAVIETTFSLLLLAMLYIGIPAICRSSSRNPSQVSVGLNGMTLIFQSGKTLYIDFFDLEAIFTIFRSSLGDDGKKLKRGLFRINRGPMYSVNPNIVIAIREAYRASRGYYPSVSTF